MTLWPPAMQWLYPGPAGEGGEDFLPVHIGHQGAAAQPPLPHPGLDPWLPEQTGWLTGQESWGVGVLPHDAAAPRCPTGCLHQYWCFNEHLRVRGPKCSEP